MSKKHINTIKKYKKSLKRHIKKVKLTCKVCGKTYFIRTWDKDIYTDEVRKSWTCLICSSRQSKNARI